MKIVVFHFGFSLVSRDLDKFTDAYKFVFRVFHTLTRSQPEGWQGFARRIDDRMVAEVNKPFGPKAQVFICGPTALVETAADAAEAAGVAAERIKTERFGPTGA